MVRESRFDFCIALDWHFVVKRYTRYTRLYIKLPMKRIPLSKNAERRATNPLGKGFSTIFLIAIFLALSGILIANSIKTISMANARNQLLKQAESEVDDLRLQNLVFQEQLGGVMSSQYVEREARNRLYYAKPGETIMVLPDSGEVTNVTQEVKKTEEKVEQRKPEGGWKRWWTFFQTGV